MQLFSKFLMSFFLPCFLLVSANLQAQDNLHSGLEVPIIRSLQHSEPGQGKVKVTQPPLIEGLLAEQIRQNTANPGLQGFRIRIFFDLGRNAGSRSLEIANNFMEEHPDIPVYRTKEPDSPYFKVSVGDFRSRDEALKLHKCLERQYPKAFIVPEWINFPSLY